LVIFFTYLLNGYVLFINKYSVIGIITTGCLFEIDRFWSKIAWKCWRTALITALRMTMLSMISLNIQLTRILKV